MLALAALCLPAAADGATINMILSDMDVSYFGGAAGNTGSLFDTIGHPGGNLNAAEADEVETAVFEVDMTHVGTLMTSPGNTISTDLRVNGVGASLALNTFLTNIGSNGGGFGLDWFTQAGNNLRLGINSVDLLLTNNVFFFTGTATVLSQNLPFGLAFVPNQNVVFSYTATLPGINGAGGGGGNTTTGAMGSGALTISGEAIPEPATIALLCTAVSILGAGAIRPRASRS
jgi:hypothetical protein